jgi:RecA-family ATPase
MSIRVHFEDDLELDEFESSDGEAPPSRLNGRYSHRRRRSPGPSDYAYNMARRNGGEPEDYDQKPVYKIWKDENALTQAGYAKKCEYPYNAPDGRLLYHSIRYEHRLVPGEKQFLQCRPTPDEVSAVAFAHGGFVKVPYRWPELIAAIKANPDTPVAYTEGEKDADTCWSLGIPATTAAGGVITETILCALEDLNISCLCILEDNDKVGRQNALKVATLTSVVVRSQKIVRIPGLKRRGDVTDWVETDPANNTKEALLEIVAKMPEWGRIKIINPAEWADKPVPPREFLVPPLLPEKNVSLLYGEGGNGKSLLALALAVARATGNRWLGLDTLPGRTLVLSAEDDQDELQRRLADIALYYKVSIGELGAIRLVDLVGQDAVIGELSRNGRIVATELHRFMIETIESFQPRLVIIDALADSFAGDENNRTQARQFISMLRKPANEYGCAFLTLAHPSLSGLMSGRGTSGSTGWNNSVRARMYLETLEVEGKEADPNLKMLRQPKANYAKAGFELALRYENGVLVPVNTGVPPSGIAKEIIVEEIFMTLLRRLYREERFVNDKIGPSFAPAIFEREPEAAEAIIRKAALRAAMVRLFQKRRIKLEPYGPLSRHLTRLTEAPL